MKMRTMLMYKLTILGHPTLKSLTTLTHKFLGGVIVEKESIEIPVVEDIESVKTISKEWDVLLYTEPSTSTGTNESGVNCKDNSNPNLLMPQKETNVLLTSGELIPSPFKKTLFWPEPSKTINKVRRNKEKNPSIATTTKLVCVSQEERRQEKRWRRKEELKDVEKTN